MDRILSFFGAVMIVVGAVCLLQSTSILPDTVMNGDDFWAWVGLALLAIGLLLCAIGLWVSRHQRAA